MASEREERERRMPLERFFNAILFCVYKNNNNNLTRIIETISEERTSLHYTEESLLFAAVVFV